MSAVVQMCLKSAQTDTDGFFSEDSHLVCLKRPHPGRLSSTQTSRLASPATGMVHGGCAPKTSPNRSQGNSVTTFTHKATSKVQMENTARMT